MRNVPQHYPAADHDTAADHDDDRCVQWVMRMAVVQLYGMGPKFLVRRRMHLRRAHRLARLAVPTGTRHQSLRRLRERLTLHKGLTA